MTLSSPQSEEADIISIENEVEKQHRSTIIMQCVDPDTGKMFNRLARYCEAVAGYMHDMNDTEKSKHAKNLVAVHELEESMKAHPASGTISLKQTLRRIGA